jgi:hypothetical protein
MGARRSNQSIGLLRFNITDEVFEQLVAKHGGDFVGQVLVDTGRDEGPETRAVYLTTAKFGTTLVGFASHHDLQDLPSRNVSRRALCAQNVGLGPDLFRRELYADRDRFVVIMIQRDPYDVGSISSMTVAMSDPKMSQFLMQIDINDFVAGYVLRSKSPAGVVLKKVERRFKDRAASSARAETALKSGK